MSCCQKKKFEGKRRARYQNPGCWPTEALLRRLIRNNEVPELQIIAVSATASAKYRAKLFKVLKRDQLGRFDKPLPRITPRLRKQMPPRSAVTSLGNLQEDEQTHSRGVASNSEGDSLSQEAYTIMEDDETELLKILRNEPQEQQYREEQMGNADAGFLADSSSSSSSRGFFEPEKSRVRHPKISSLPPGIKHLFWK